MSAERTFDVFPVGYVRRSGDKTRLEILESFAPALKQLEFFSHVHVFWWAGAPQEAEYRETTQCQPPYEGAPVTGAFACRSPARPNPIGLTTAQVLQVDLKRGVVEIADLDAYDDTPLLDLKPHIPADDRVKEVKTSPWMSGWPEWMPDEGLGLKAQGEASKGLGAETFEIIPVGRVRQGDGIVSLDVDPAFAPALKHLEQFSHVRVLWWFHRFQDERFRRSTQNTPPYENAPVTGVFASRSPVRPNPIGLTTAEIVRVDHERGRVEIGGIDAYDDTPLIDLKPYVPGCDRVRRFAVPRWIAHWPEWMRGHGETAVVDPHHLCPADSRRLSAFQVTPPAPPPQEGAAVLSPLAPQEEEDSDIVIRGARQHNLKNLNLTIPRNKLTVITGVSGSGKSSLAFDTLYAEGQRRYVESLSTLARRLVGQMFELYPALFSFNNPDGMCPDCNGLGVKLDVDLDLVVTQPELSLLDGASPWYGEMRHVKPSGNWMRCELLGLAEHYDVDLELPWNELPQEFRHVALYGSGGEIITWSYDVKSSRARGWLELRGHPTKVQSSDRSYDKAVAVRLWMVSEELTGVRYDWSGRNENRVI